MTHNNVLGESLPSTDRVPHPLGTLVPARLREALTSAVSDLGNVIAFAPRRRAGTKPAPAVAADVAERPAPRSLVGERRWSWSLLVAGSLVIHGGLLAALLREPDARASIGVEAMTIELVLGANNAAGPEPKPNETEATVTSPPVPHENKPQAIQPEVAATEPAKQQAAASQPLQANTPPQAERPEIAVDPKPAEKPTTIAALPTRQDVRDAPKPKPDIKAAPTRKRDSGKNARDRAAPASPPSVASSGVGRGRSDADSNYHGLVLAHLMRHRRPVDRQSGMQAPAMVNFSLDGTGRVTSVRLARASGVGSVDQEAQAVVRRASPFPAPPSGRAVAFSVPVQLDAR